MDNIDNIMQLCRLCLVKDQVNVPIFGGTNDIEEISSKISSCLPVKVSPDDSLPKKICDDCSYKLDLLYVFRNTSINSEKQLYQWLEQAGISKTTSGTISTTQSLTTPILATDSTIPSVPISTLDTVINDTITKSEISVKQEKTESTAGSELSAETQEYLLQQQKLPYQENFGDFNTTGTNSATAETEEPARKKPRRAAASKPPIKDNESDPDVPPTKAEDDSDEDIDDAGDGGGMDDDDDEEEEEEDDGLDHPEFVDVPSTSAEEQPGPSGVNKDPIAAPDEPLYNLSHQCMKCRKFFKTNFNLRTHLTSVHEENRPFSCDICNKSFKQKGHLQRHYTSLHTDSTFDCNICQKQFKTIYNLRHHQRRHFKDRKKHLCNFCGRSFFDRYGFVRHLSMHEENYKQKRNFKCELCSSTFLQMEYLRRHMKSQHSDNRRKYTCELCGKEFVTPAGYKDHKDSHSGVKSFECVTCGKKFFKKFVLQIHMRTHTGEKPYTCTTCGKTFAHSSGLRVHLRSHNPEKPYKCSVCNRSLFSKYTLKHHMEKKHQKV